MDWIQVVTIIGSLGAFGWYFLNRLEKDIDKIDKKCDAFERRMDSHAARIDQLYGMFVQLLQRDRK